jgi:peptide chain release factor subunit 1
VLAGIADFKNDLQTSDMFDPRLRAVVMKVVDISYGGKNGFNQAIELCSEDLCNVKFIREKKLISTFFDEISHDTGRFAFGVADTLKACEMGAAKILLVWENLETVRHTLRNNVTGEETVLLRLDNETPAVASNEKLPSTTAFATEYEVIESMSLAEWLADNFK